MQKCNLWLNAYEFMTHKTDFFNTEFHLMLQFEASVSTVTSCCHLHQVAPPSGGAAPTVCCGLLLTWDQGTRPCQLKSAPHWENWE